MDLYEFNLHLYQLSLFYTSFIRLIVMLSFGVKKRELEHWKNYDKNGYSSKFIGKYELKFLNKLHLKELAISLNLRKELYCFDIFKNCFR